MKLARYLKDYIVTERQRDTIGDVGHSLQEIIQAGIEAFASTEDIELTSDDFISGWKHFCNHIDFGRSNLDGRSIRFMNEVPSKVVQILRKME